MNKMYSPTLLIKAGVGHFSLDAFSCHICCNVLHLSVYLPARQRACLLPALSLNTLVRALAKASELALWFGGVALERGLRGMEAFFQMDAFTN